jgi:hypothetical protein
MPFESGHPKYPGAGNPKGGTIKRSLAALAITEENKVCPVTFLCDVINSKYPEASFDHKLQAAKELLPYLFPKLKQMELTTEGGSDLFAKLAERLSGTNS